MNGVQRGARVTWTQDGVQLRGLVLDRALAATTWWVMPSGAQRAVEVKASQLEPCR